MLLLDQLAKTSVVRLLLRKNGCDKVTNERRASLGHDHEASQSQFHTGQSSTGGSVASGC